MKILFVCLGNICRSPMAEAVFAWKIQHQGLPYTADSAGTGNWHAGERPDKRTLKTLAAYGIETAHRARQVTAEDFQNFDLIIAMDRENMKALETLRSKLSNPKAGLYLMRHFDSMEPGSDVPDPYFGEMDGFQTVYEQLNRSVDGLIAHINSLH